MDNLKKNLHFVVFGAGIVVGLLLLGLGYVVRGGEEGALEQKLKSLSAKQQVETRGDLSAAEKARAEFDAALSEALTLLEERGAALTRVLPGESSEPTAFLEQRSRPFIDDMRARFGAMDGKLPLPDRMQGWTLQRGGRAPDGDFWSRYFNTLQAATREQLPEIRYQLRIIEEVCATCELLLATENFRGQRVKLNEFKFEPPVVSDANTPWTEIPYLIDLECTPEFGHALQNELVSPSQLTSGATAADKRRMLFPNRLDSMQFMAIPRPLVMRYSISPEQRAREGIPETLDTGSEQGRAMQQRKIEEFERDVRPVLPLQFAIKLRAQSWNSNWQVVSPPQAG